jgi:hypothetical protein
MRAVHWAIGAISARLQAQDFKCKASNARPQTQDFGGNCGRSIWRPESRFGVGAVRS